MKRRYALGFVIGGAFVAGSAQAQYASETFMPENDLHLQDCLECEQAGGLTKEQFDAINEKGKTLFSPIIEALGGTLKVNGKWTDNTVNASATQLFGTWQVNMYGGLARRAEVTPDGFTLVLCHEIGHHLGGFPFVSSWGADEGQADYFATHVCPALWWSTETEKNAEARASIPEAPKAACDAVWSTEDAQNLCYRTALAGKSLGDLLAALKQQTVSFETHDPNEVTKTDHAHPAAQCRLDTYVAGAVCTQAWDNALIPGKKDGRGQNDAAAEEESGKYTCTAAGQFTSGLRPRCWFKPGA